MATLRGALGPVPVVLMTVAIILGGLAASQLITDNFHMIVQGQAYRSAQPSASDIEGYRRDYGIASIINLRNDGPGNGWYDAEIKTAAKLGIKHFDFPMSARKMLTTERAQQLVELLKSAPKPVLIHCKAGSDRTGLASALYLAAVTKAGEESAEGQLSIRYGHVAVPFFGTIEMDQTFEAMEPSLGFAGS